MTFVDKIKKKIFRRYYKLIDEQKNLVLCLKTLEKQNSELIKKNEAIELQNDLLAGEVKNLKGEIKSFKNEILILKDEIDSINNDIKSVKKYKSEFNRQLKTALWDNYKKTTYRIYRYMPLNMWQRAVEDEGLEFTGYPFDLNNPKTLNEKVSWLKLYDQRPLLSRVADKYLVRDYVIEKTGQKNLLVNLVGVYDSVDEIDFNVLPDKFVIKTNHGSGYNIIVKSKSEINLEEVKKTINKYLNEEFSYKTLEPHYLGIKKRILIEEYLENDDLGLNDYKVFCFNGKPYAILFISGRYTEKRVAFYDLDWNRLPYTIKNSLSLDTDIEKPKNFIDLLNLAAKLSADFTMARVDFYILNSGDIKFSEITLTPAAGHSGLCYEADVDFGKQIKMPNIDPIKYRG